MTVPRKLLSEYPALSEWSILLCYRGSIAHGMYVAPTEPTGIDDKDLLGVCVPPPPYYLGLKEYGSRGTEEIKRDEWDIVVYEARKLFSLLLKGNPNVLCALWLDEKNIISISDAGHLVLSMRDLFVGKHVYHSFVGYAYGQLHRMTHGAHLGYMGQKRQQLVEKYGYDTKNAAHLIRLLRMAIEFLTEGALIVQRPDAQQLLEIKRGLWTLEAVKAEADRLFTLAQEAYVRSSLPAKPDAAKVSELCEAVIWKAWG